MGLPDGFQNHVRNIMSSSSLPIMVTEFGQSTCDTNGACFSYQGTWNGQKMGYDEAILQIGEQFGVSMTPWSWRPGATEDRHQQWDMNFGTDLSHAIDNKGADWSVLWPKYFLNQEPPKTTPSTTKPPGQCSDVWKQCGGKNWNGPTCCKGSCGCVLVNEYYSQCRPTSGNNCLSRVFE